MGLARVAAAYRTVPVETLCTITEVTPWELKVEERRRLFRWEGIFLDQGHEEEGRTRSRRAAARLIQEGDYEELEGGGTARENREPDLDIEEFNEGRRNETRGERERALRKWLKKKAKEETTTQWKGKWEKEILGRWTYRLIPDPEIWNKRKHGELNFFPTQVLTGHGVFNSFRKRIGKSGTDACWYHEGVVDTPEHTIVECDRWKDERKELREEIGIGDDEEIRIEDLIDRILSSRKDWNAFSKMCKCILTQKAEEERRREENGEDSAYMQSTDQDLESREIRRMEDL